MFMTGDWICLLGLCVKQFLFDGRSWSQKMKARFHQNSLNKIILESYCPLFPYVYHVSILNLTVLWGTVPIIALKSTYFFAYQLTLSNLKNKVNNIGIFFKSRNARCSLIYLSCSCICCITACHPCFLIWLDGFLAGQNVKDE